MSPMQTARFPAASAPRAPSRGLLIRLALGTLIPLGIVAAAVLPKIKAQGLSRLAPWRPHPPQLWRVLEVSPAIQLHLLAVTVALGVGVVLLVGVKGDRLHRTLGWTWVLAMMTAAVSSLFIRVINHGQLSFIHLLSGWTIMVLPMAVALARRHKVRAHARAMTALFTGGLVLAGLFAFTPGRLMWQVMFG